MHFEQKRNYLCQSEIWIPFGSAACEGRSIVCFVCVLVRLFLLVEKGALFLWVYNR